MDTYAQILVHVVFATRDRLHVLTPEIRARLFPYFGGLAAKHRGKLLKAGGVEDHVHLLLSLRPNPSISKIVQHLKGTSSHWINETFDLDFRFAWQIGYGVFSVSPSQVSTVRRYLQRQEEHHRRRTFAEERDRLIQHHEITHLGGSTGRAGVSSPRDDRK